jgi:hypothetical protein
MAGSLGSGIDEAPDPALLPSSPPVGESVSHTSNSTLAQHALCSHPRELESHHYTRWCSHRWPKRRADRFLLATVELSARRAILHLEAIAAIELRKAL